MIHVSVVGQHIWPELRVDFKYNARVISAVKGVPGARWDPYNRCWTIPTMYAQSLATALLPWAAETVWSGVENPIPPTPPPPPPAPQPQTCSWADALFNSLRPDLHDSVFRALARVLHPDAGGDAAMMRDLLEARSNAV